MVLLLVVDEADSCPCCCMVIYSFFFLGNFSFYTIVLGFNQISFCTYYSSLEGTIYGDENSAQGCHYTFVSTPGTRPYT